MEEVERVIDYCAKLVAANQRAYVDPDALWIAGFVLKTLGAAFPPDRVPPRIKQAPDGAVVMISTVEIGSRDEALGIGAALIRLALTLPEDKASP